MTKLHVSDAVDGAIRAVVFDLGGVLIDWNPRHLYRKLFADAVAMEQFLATVCTQAWNEEQDAGRPWDEAVVLLAARHPQHRELIAAYHHRWDEMLADPIAGSVEILADLRASRTPVYALTNWSAEKFPIARARYAFLAWFDGIVVSGEVGMRKPDPRIFGHLLERHGLAAPSTLLIDDSPANVAAARGLGMAAVPFTTPDRLRADLKSFGLLENAAP